MLLFVTSSNTWSLRFFTNRMRFNFLSEELLPLRSFTSVTVNTVAKNTKTKKLMIRSTLSPNYGTDRCTARYVTWNWYGPHIRVTFHLFPRLFIASRVVHRDPLSDFFSAEKLKHFFCLEYPGEGEISRKTILYLWWRFPRFYPATLFYKPETLVSFIFIGLAVWNIHNSTITSHIYQDISFVVDQCN